MAATGSAKERARNRLQREGKTNQNQLRAQNQLVEPKNQSNQPIRTIGICRGSYSEVKSPRKQYQADFETVAGRELEGVPQKSG